MDLASSTTASFASRSSRFRCAAPRSRRNSAAVRCHERASASAFFRQGVPLVLDFAACDAGPAHIQQHHRISRSQSNAGIGQRDFCYPRQGILHQIQEGRRMFHFLLNSANLSPTPA